MSFRRSSFLAGVMVSFYFSEEECRKCTPPCHISDLQPELLLRLDCARQIAGIPFVLNSAYRSVEYEKSKGRAGTSSHTKGVAVDIRCTNNQARRLMIPALLRAGFARIGIAPTFIHVDCDPSKVDSIWLYG